MSISDVNLEYIAEGRARRLMNLANLDIVADLIGDRVVIWDPELGYEVFMAGFFGKPIGVRKPRMVKFNKPLELSIYDALYLLEKGVIKIRNISGNMNNSSEFLKPDELMRIGSESYKDFEAKYKVYRDLRDKGFVVRPGLKFGSDFSVYRYGPGIDHAPFLVTVFSKDTKLLGVDLVRAGRLANSVRKKWVIAVILEDGSIRYLVFSWYRL